LSDDPYALLDVARDADLASIRAAYRTLARAHHPDVGGDAVTMAALNEAWHTLRTPERRAAYDAQAATQRPGRSGLRPIVYAPPPKRSRHAGAAMGTVLDFGRYSGVSIDALAQTDPDYLEWLARTPIGRSLGKEIADSLGRARVAAATPRVARQPPRSRTRTGWLGR
jgi:curved DNA-binding protein CbpA